MIKNIIFNNRNKHRNKNKSTAVTKNELKYFPMSEGNTCIAVSKLEVLPLIWFSKGLVYFLFCYKFKNLCMDWCHLFEVFLLYYQMTTNSAVNTNLTSVMNNLNYSSKGL